MRSYNEYLKSEQIERIQRMFSQNDIYYLYTNEIPSSLSTLFHATRYVSGKKITKFISDKFSNKSLEEIPSIIGQLCEDFVHLGNISNFIQAVTGIHPQTKTDKDTKWLIHTFKLLKSVNQTELESIPSVNNLNSLCHEMESSIYVFEGNERKIMRPPSDLELNLLSHYFRMNSQYSEDLYQILGKILLAGILHPSLKNQKRNNILTSCTMLFLEAVVDLNNETNIELKKHYISFLRAAKQIFFEVFRGEHFKTNIGMPLYASTFSLNNNKTFLSKYNRFINDFSKRYLQTH